MSFKVLLISLFFIGIIAQANTLECVFEISAPASLLDVEGGVDRCESGDKYCAKIDINGIKAKGCSMTALKITGQGTGQGLPMINCDRVGCNAQNSLCCCQKDKCNGSKEKFTSISLLCLAFMKIFVMQ